MAAIACWSTIWEPTDTAMDGDNSSDRFIEALARLRPITTLAAERTPDYRLDVLRAEPSGKPALICLR